MSTAHRLRLAPTGHRCGLFFAVGKESASLTVMVLPKPWALRELYPEGTKANAPAALVHRNGNRLLVVGHEADVAIIRHRDSTTDPLNELIAAVDRQINDDRSAKAQQNAKNRKAMERKPGNPTGPPDAPRSGLQDSAQPADAGTEQDELEEEDDPGLGALLSIEGAGSKSNPTDQSHASNDDHSAVVIKGLSALIHLAARAGGHEWTSRPSTDAAEHDDTEAGGAVSSHRSARTADPLMLLAQWRLVELIGAHLRQLRRGYVPVKEEAPVIRGRMTQRGLLQAAARLGPRIECAHDDFSDNTPLFRVLVTALDRVASGALAEAHGVAAWSVMAQVRARAVHLRRQLHQLPSLPWAQAAAEAGRLSRRPLPRALRVWQPALHLARAILRDEAVRPLASDDGVVAQHWWLNTSKLWEGILEQICKKAGWKVSAPAENSCVLWDKLGNKKKPDLLLENDGQRIVADAKYKLLNGGALSAADQYQLFAYSHTASWDDAAPATAATVLYPCDQPSEPRAFARHGELRFNLHLIGVPFPTKGELEPKDWTTYIEKAAMALKPLNPIANPAPSANASPTPPAP
jgi:hypothetical protein